MKKYVCTICGYVYDEEAGIPSAGIEPGTKWKDLPADWICPLCGASKSDFKELADAPAAAEPQPIEENEGELRALSYGELSALCSSLARGCEKQYLQEESALFAKLSEYYKSNTPSVEPSGPETLSALVQNDLNEGFPQANSVASAHKDRGALRALTWSEKVTRILNSILSRYEKEGEAFLEHTNIYVCDTCGFIYVGDKAPEMCPVCKVPGWKFSKVERR